MYMQVFFRFLDIFFWLIFRQCCMRCMPCGEHQLAGMDRRHQNLSLISAPKLTLDTSFDINLHKLDVWRARPSLQTNYVWICMLYLYNVIKCCYIGSERELKREAPQFHEKARHFEEQESLKASRKRKSNPRYEDGKDDANEENKTVKKKEKRKTGNTTFIIFRVISFVHN